MKTKLTDLRYWWEEWIKPIIIAALLAMFIRTFVIQPFKIPSSSMVPTFVPGDRIFVNKFVYGARIPFTDIRLPSLDEPSIGDIVVFTSPVEDKKFLVKRFIASGGQVVAIRDGEIFIDDRPVEEERVRKFFYYNRGDIPPGEEGIRVPDGEFYVLGDNSANSLDSRYWGAVPEENMVGKAFLIHWPPRRIRLITRR